MPAPQKVKLPPRKKKKHGNFAWGTLFSGLVIGIFSTWLVMNDDIKLMTLIQGDSDTTTTETPKDKSNDIVENLPIEFYQLLPSREEEIPAHIISQQVRNASNDKPMEKPGRYRLQAGSFQKLVDADRRRANITLLGLDTHIEKVTHAGKTWHRVMLGPFESLRSLEIARRRMDENKIKTIVLKLKNKT